MAARCAQTAQSALARAPRDVSGGGFPCRSGASESAGAAWLQLPLSSSGSSSTSGPSPSSAESWPSQPRPAAAPSRPRRRALLALFRCRLARYFVVFADLARPARVFFRCTEMMLVARNINSATRAVALLVFGFGAPSVLVICELRRTSLLSFIFCFLRRLSQQIRLCCVTVPLA